jgi:hypothetical protein
MSSHSKWLHQTVIPKIEDARSSAPGARSGVKKGTPAVVTKLPSDLNSLK